MSLRIGIGKNLKITPSGITYEPEVLIYINGLATPLSTNEINLLNNLVLGLKSDLSISSLADFFDQILLYTGETSEVGLRNLVQNLYHASLVGAVAYNQYLGFTPNGINSYINRGYNPVGFPGNYKQNDGSIGMYIRNNIQLLVASVVHGSQSAGAIKVGMNPYRNATNARIWINQNGDNTAVNPVSTSVGWTIGVRTASNLSNAFRNITKGPNSADVSNISPYNGNLYDGACNLNGVATNFIAHQIAISFVAKAPSDAQESAIITRFNTYMASH